MPCVQAGEGVEDDPRQAVLHVPGPADGVPVCGAGVVHQHRLHRLPGQEPARLEVEQRAPVRGGALGEDQQLVPHFSIDFQQAKIQNSLFFPPFCTSLS